MNIKITSDSTCDLSAEQLERHHIQLLPLCISMGDKLLRDGLEIHPDDIYAHVDAGGDICTTSALNIADYTDCFAPLSREYDAVIHINISAEFSSCHQNAVLASQEFDNVYVVDSRNLSTGHGHVVLRAAELAESGMDAKDIVAQLNAFAPKVDASFILSQPSRIWHTLTRFSENKLLLHIGVTVYETLTGFLLGVVIGVFAAIILWWSPFIARVAEPYLVVLNSLPKIALGPVIIIVAGAGTGAIIFMALAISLIVTVLEMLAGFVHTDPESIKMARTFGATRRQVFTKIVFPSNLDTLFNSLKINIGLSLVGVIAGEFLVSKAGLGYLIVYGGQVFRMDLVMTGVLVLSVVAAAMYQAVSLLQKAVRRRYGSASR